MRYQAPQLEHVEEARTLVQGGDKNAATCRDSGGGESDQSSASAYEVDE